ncbi:RNA-directed DNA polymerase, eukaryota [Tanacetum coccineum]|uniref:RNA-directed DNA polymerase, eukaryota n=1 Tax=Tanacetum coccineum TaxID=301880 RepID=A0ABQ5BBH6_9ASTR
MGIDDWQEVSRKNNRYRTKEDDVIKILISIYVSNFPESFSAKDLFHACSKYGHVVDSFIPSKRSKEGRCKLQANIARFDRSSLNNRNTYDQWKNVRNSGTNVVGPNGGSVGNENTFANVLSKKHVPMSDVIDSQPVIVLDDDCVQSQDLTLSLMGKIVFKGVYGEDGLLEILADTDEEFRNCLEKQVVLNRTQVGTKSIVFRRPLGIYSILYEKKCDKCCTCSKSNSGSKEEEAIKGVILNSMSDKGGSVNMGRFKTTEVPRSGGSFLSLMEDVVKVGVTMGYNMDGVVNNLSRSIENHKESCDGESDLNFLSYNIQGLAPKAKKRLGSELAMKNKVNFYDTR